MSRKNRPKPLYKTLLDVLCSYVAIPLVASNLAWGLLVIWGAGVTDVMPLGINLASIATIPISAFCLTVWFSVGSMMSILRAMKPVR